MFRLALSSLALLLLAACGGGGGSSSSAPATPAGIPVSIQGPNTTQQYPVSSAAATFSTNTGVGVSGIAASDGGSTVTVSTDANGNLSMFTLNISTGGINYNQTFTSFSPITQPLTVSDIANGLNEIANAPAGSTAAFVTSQNNGQLKGLSFSAFGGWIANDNAGSFRLGVMAGGVETPLSAVPTTGTATYNGTTLGMGATGTTAFALSGNAQIVADFSNQLVSTMFSNIVTQNIVGGGRGTLPGLTGLGALNGNNYQTTIAGAYPMATTGFVGQANGTFYGPNAQETAGVWKASDGTTTAMGSFGAKR